MQLIFIKLFQSMPTSEQSEVDTRRIFRHIVINPVDSLKSSLQPIIHAYFRSFCEQATFCVSSRTYVCSAPYATPTSPAAVAIRDKVLIFPQKICTKYFITFRNVECMNGSAE